MRTPRNRFLWIFDGAVAAGAVISIAASIACSSPLRPESTQADQASRRTRITESDEGDACTLTLGQPTTASQMGGAYAVDLRASCLWTVVSDQPWLTTSARPSVWSGIERITYTVAANNSAAARTGRLVVSGGGTTAQTIVTQNGISAPTPPSPTPQMTVVFISAQPSSGSTIQAGSGSSIDIRVQLSLASPVDISGRIFSGAVNGTIPSGCIVALVSPVSVTLRAGQPQTVTLGPYRYFSSSCVPPFTTQGIAYEMVPIEDGPVPAPTYFNTGVNWPFTFVQ